jgi:TolA-binding protein
LRVPSSDAPRRAVADLDARQLFVAAGQARRERDFSEAARLYTTLQERYPKSPEATLSFLSLGDLSLSQGAATRALAQFDAYLASGDAMMAEEALVGRARTLARLGRTEEERAAWRALLSLFPQSDYRWRAQQRLDHAGDTP